MEMLIESLTKEEFFRGNGFNGSGLDLKGRRNIIVPILIGCFITGFTVYLFRYEIEDFINHLSNKPTDNID